MAEGHYRERKPEECRYDAFLLVMERVSDAGTRVRAAERSGGSPTR
jgi:hypothetical protein